MTAPALIAAATIDLGSAHALSIARPEVFWLLLGVPALWLATAFTRQEIGPRRRVASVALRTLAALLVVAALGGPTLDRRAPRAAVVYLVDVSASVPDESLRHAADWVEKSAAALGEEDLACLLAFDGEVRPVLRPRPARELKVEEALARGPRDATARTDVEGALRAAAAFVPEGFSGRVVLLTDGNENRGHGADEAARLLDRGVPVTVVPLPRPAEEKPDVLLEAIVFPQARAREGEAVEGRIIAHATREVEGTLRIYRNGVLEFQRDVKLAQGKNPPIAFTQQLDQKGLYAFEAIFTGKQDARPENNRAIGFLSVEGSPRVLIIEEREAQARHLASALKKSRMTVTVRNAAGVPRDMADLEGFDVVIFSDVPTISPTTGISISIEQMELIRDYVHQFGGGFIMVGGENSFGLGGYYRTPIEECLPVKMEIPKKIEIPAIAMALVLDKSGSMSGPKVELAKEASRRVVELLKDRDFIAVVTFDSSFHWAVPMTRCIDKPRIADSIGRIAAGGGTFMYPAMEQAYEELRKVNAKIKHMIVLTDGQTNPADHESLVRRMVAERMTLSSVGIGDGADRALLERLAQLGGGRHYFTTDFNNLPQIFVQETIKASRSAITEDPFKPRRMLDRPYVSGIGFAEGPPLLGYVTTKPKETAEVVLASHHDDPVLAVWQHGLGKTAAFTSDAKAKWASAWVRWDGYTKLWSQLVRAVMRSRSRHDLHAEVVVQEGKAKLVVDAVDENGAFINEAVLAAELYYWRPLQRPDDGAANGGGEEPGAAVSSGGADAHSPTERPVELLHLVQTGPGRYEAELAADAPGGYLLKFRDENGLVETRGFAISYSPEYAAIGLDEPGLRRLGEAGGGPFGPEPAAAIAAPQTDTASRRPLIEILAAIAACLLVVDLGIRRLRSLQEILPG